MKQFLELYYNILFISLAALLILENFISLNERAEVEDAGGRAAFKDLLPREALMQDACRDLEGKAWGKVGAGKVSVRVCTRMGV